MIVSRFYPERSFWSCTAT